MNLIDHRILIPTSPERVWHFVGDLKRNTEWQVNCRSISMLTSTTKPQPGTRMRITPDRGREYVIEITAWYDRFGYEYNVVEGGSFRENKGTLRLQEVPEGTIVQWTFSYRPGLFGGGSARAQETQIIDSLRGLYKLITKSKEVETFQAKSLMRDDPGVEARASYRPRHPYGDTVEGTASQVKGAPRQPTKPQQPVVITEPPRKPDDTKPRPVIVVPTPPPAVAMPPVQQSYTPSGSPVIEPDFLIEEPNVPAVDVPSEKVAPISSATPIPYVPPPLLTPPPVTPVDVPVVKPVTETVPPVLVTTPDSAPPLTEPPIKIADTRQRVAEPLDDTSQKPKQDTAPVAAMYPTPAEVMPAIKMPQAPRRDRDKLMDTSRISVFEVFGLPKPSETQEIEPLQVDASGDPVAVAAAAEQLPPMPNIETVLVPAAEGGSGNGKHGLSDARRYGMRAMMRKQAAKVRTPH